jgi:hypothetical protein
LILGDEETKRWLDQATESLHHATTIKYQVIVLRIPSFNHVVYFQFGRVRIFTYSDIYHHVSITILVGPIRDL